MRSLRDALPRRPELSCGTVVAGHRCDALRRYLEESGPDLPDVYDETEGGRICA